MNNEKELKDSFKMLIDLSDKEIKEIKSIIDEIIEHKIQDDDILSHLYDRILSIVFLKTIKRWNCFISYLIM